MGGLRSRHPRRRLRGEPGTADRRPCGDGDRRGPDLPRDALAAHQRLHRARRAGPGYRALGSDDRDRDRLGPDRRRLALRALRLGERLLRPRPGRGARLALVAVAFRPPATPTPPPPTAWPRPLHRGDRDPDLHDHRGSEGGLGLGPQHRGPRRGSLLHRLHRLGAPARHRCSTSGSFGTSASAPPAGR